MNENEETGTERTTVSVAPIAISTSRRGNDVAMVRRRSVLVGARDERECIRLLSPIAAFLFGLIQRLIRRLN